MKPIYVWIDDIRDKPQVNYVSITCRDYASAIDLIDYFTSRGVYLMLDFDHDLGEGKTGYDIAKYIVENQIPTDLIRYHIHSSNPVGAMNIRQLLDHYGYRRFLT